MKFLYSSLCPRINVPVLLVATLSILMSACGNDSNSNTTSATVAPITASTALLNDQWHYLENDSENLSDIQAVAQTWQAVYLPHTWNATDTVDSVPGYRRAGGWYKREFEVTDSARYKIYFEGANLETDVYLNDQHVGQHIGGYLGFEFELTPYLKRNQTNTLWVRVSNRFNPDLIPSQKADFFIHGGITRDVWLKRLPEVSVAKVKIDTPQVSVESANTRFSIAVEDLRVLKEPLMLNVNVTDPTGKLVAQQSQPLNLNDTATQTLTLDTIKTPMLWSPASPALYRADVQLLTLSGDLVHETRETYGYRWFEMRPNQGFFVNGERVLIRGTHRHEEHAGVGAAVSNAQHRADMQQIKDMGANFVRLGHYPQDPEVYKAADELGLIIWDELPWCRGGKGGEQWEQNTERLWREQIAQNYNHASIAFWSLGNEIYWEEDFEGGGKDEVVLPFLKKLNTLTKSLDASRLTTIRKYYPGAKVVDAFSPSIWAGWYGGAYGQYAEAIKQAMDTYPTFLHMEYGGSSHVGRHSETPVPITGIADAQVSVSEAMNQAVVKSVAKDTNWNENYMVNLFDWHLHVSESTPNFAGNAQWAFKDFGTPLRPENPIPFMNQKGLVDRSGKPKDAYYVFASYWAEKPFCYIESKTWTVRYGTAEGRPVKVYCNTDSAELFLNGKSLGEKDRHYGEFPAHGLVWQVPFVQGQNTLSVIGRVKDSDQQVQDKLQLEYVVGQPGSIANVKLTQSALGNNRYLIMAEALDANGKRVIDYSERAYFSLLNGHGELLKAQGTPTGSDVIEMADGVAKIEFTAGKREAVIEFRTQNTKGVYVRVPAAN